MDQPWQFVVSLILAFGSSFGAHFFYNYKVQYNRMVLRGQDVKKNRVNDVVYYTLCNVCYLIFIVLITSNNLYLLIMLFLGKSISEFVNILTQPPDPITIDNVLTYIKLNEIKRLLKI
tara:strand:+ start:217 stop:570 length:354 start_codon:yes stop_codon:yes gene_type:complete